MDTKLLLVKAITLLYLNGKLDEKQTDAVEIAKMVLEAVKPKDNVTLRDFGGIDPIVELRNTLVEMASMPLGTEFEESELTQRFKIIVNTGDGCYDALLNGFVLDSDPKDKILKMYNHQKYSISSYLSKNKIADILKNYYIKATHHQDSIDYRTFANEISESLAPYAINEDARGGIYNHPSIVNNVRMNDMDTLTEAFESVADELDSRGIIKTPYQGINRMMGSHGGIRRGEMVVITALTHNYKSGMVLDMWTGCALFNKPYMRDADKKPLNLRISFENSIQVDLNNVYIKLKETETGLVQSIKDIDPDVAAEYVYDRLSINGYYNQIIHISPTDFTFHDLFKLIEQIENDGYEIHLLTIDYLNMMSKAGCAQGATGDDIRDLFRRVRNFTLRKGIAMVTPHQFSSEARKVDRSEPRNFVKVVTGKGYYDGCSRLEQEIDLEISINLVEFNNETYLTAQRGKHRGVDRTPIKDMYTVYKFEPIGGLPMDINGEDMSRRGIGSDTQAEGGALAWHDGIL